MQAIEQAERELKGNGRVNVRYSGTESLARVMVEAETEEIVQRFAGRIAEALESAIGLGVPSAH
jgi:phosphoglucosamine mutase